MPRNHKTPSDSWHLKTVRAPQSEARRWRDDPKHDSGWHWIKPCNGMFSNSAHETGMPGARPFRLFHYTMYYIIYPKCRSTSPQIDTNLLYSIQYTSIWYILPVVFCVRLKAVHHSLLCTPATKAWKAGALGFASLSIMGFLMFTGSSAMARRSKVWKHRRCSHCSRSSKWKDIS